MRCFQKGKKQWLLGIFLCLLFPFVTYAEETITKNSTGQKSSYPHSKKPLPVQKISSEEAKKKEEVFAPVKSALDVVGNHPEGLDLQECFQITATRSDTLQITKESIEAAKARLVQSVAEIFPTFNLVQSQIFRDTGQAFGNNFGNQNFNQNNSTSSTQITVSQPIFNGFSNYNKIGAAQAGIEVQRYNLERAYQTLYQDVAQAFYQILSNEGDLLILGDSVKALEARAQELGERVRIGRSRPSDLLQSEADLASARVTIEETKGLLAAARELMAFYLGIPAEKIKLRETQTFPRANIFEKYLQVTGTRPDILALVQSERMARRNLSVSKGALFPALTVNGTYTVASDPIIQQNWMVTLQVQLPLFDGGLILSRIREQKALVRQSEFNLDNLRRTADQDIRTSFVNFNASAAQVVRIQEEVELAMQNYNAQVDDYKKGIVTNLNVLTALNNLQAARRKLNTADLNARLNLIKLHVAAGLAATSQKPQTSSP